MAPAAAGAASMLTTIGVVAFWYISNVGVVMLNKQLISNFGFKYPVLLTLSHMSVCSLMGFVLARTGALPHTTVKSRDQMIKIIALALVFCLSIVLANLSLRYIPVSFNQAIGATTPAFTAVCAFFIQSRIETMTVYSTLVPVVLGVVIASGFEPSFNIIGFTSCIAATIMRALKTVLGGVLLSDGEKMDSISLMLYMSPVAAAALVPAAMLLEPSSIMAAREIAAENPWFLPLLALSSFGAYFQNVGNFLVTKYTSPLTLQVLGNGKGVVAVVVSVLWFQNPVSLYGLAGYGVTVAGVVAYSQAKRMGAAATAGKHGQQKSDEEAPLLKPAALAGKKSGQTSPKAGEIKAAKLTPGKLVMSAKKASEDEAPPTSASRSAKGTPAGEPVDALGWLRQQIGLDSQ